MANYLRCIELFVCLEDQKLPKRLFYDELLHAKYSQHKPKKLSKDNITANWYSRLVIASIEKIWVKKDI